jgi:hypothetical protein
MWSRGFLWTGLLSGVAIAAMAIAALWLGVFVYSGDKDPAWTVANIAKFTLPGLIVYPASWYMVIFRSRDYSLSRTMRLTAFTFAAGTAVVGIVLMVGGLFVAIDAIMSVSQPWKALPFLILGPVAYAIMTALGVVILIVPYTIVATPTVLLHRWLLLTVFAYSGPATPSPPSPSLRSSVPIVPSH